MRAIKKLGFLGERIFIAFCFVTLAIIVAIPYSVGASSPPQLISKDLNSQTHNGRAYRPFVSADGALIAFSTSAQLTASAPDNVSFNVFVYSLRSNRIIWNSTLGSGGSEGTFVNGMSADGRHLLLYADSDMSDDGAGPGLFVYNLETGSAVRVSLDVDGTPIPGMSSLGYTNGSMSTNGRYVIFNANLFDETGGHAHTFIHDLSASTTEMLDNEGGTSSISDDGRYVALTSSSGNDNTVKVYDRTNDDVIEPTPLIPYGQASINSVRIAPDGSSVVFNGAKNGLPGQDPNQLGPTHVFQMTIPDGIVTDLTPSEGLKVMSELKGDFSPDSSFFTLSSQMQLTSQATDGKWAVYSYNIVTNSFGFVDFASDIIWPSIAAAESDVSDSANVAAYLVEYYSPEYHSNIYVRTVDGWTPSAETWTPQPWDDTPIESPPGEPQTFSLAPLADTYVRSGQSNRNHGAGQYMQIQASGDNRALVKFNQPAIAAAVGSGTVLSAKLRLTITDNGNNWGSSGRTVDVHRLTKDWAEGNGTENDRGTGGGATWECAVDTNIQNQAKNCSGPTVWEMGQPNNPSVHPWDATASASQTITNGQSGIAEYDVTADVAAFLGGSSDNYGWMIKKTNEGQNGQVSFGTKESSFAPELVIVFQP